MKLIACLIFPFAFHACVALSYSWEDNGKEQTVTVGIDPPVKVRHQK